MGDQRWRNTRASGPTCPFGVDSYLMRYHSRNAPLTERFWAKVNKYGPEHPTLGRCWNWQGPPNQKGYGSLTAIQLGVGNWQNKRAHHIAVFLETGVWPTQCVLHKCDNRLCVNTAHLYLGTQLQNIADRNNRNRTARGEAHGFTKLTSQDVINIIRLHKRGLRVRSIMAVYKISEPTVHSLVSGRAWKYLDRSPANRPVPAWSTRTMGFVR